MNIRTESSHTLTLDELDLCPDMQQAVLISSIAKRGLPILHNLGATGHDLLSANMDIEAVHEAHNLDLEKFLAFDDHNFTHDFVGIYVNLDRTTKVLRNCFSPRCSA